VSGSLSIDSTEVRISPQRTEMFSRKDAKSQRPDEKRFLSKLNGLRTWRLCAFARCLAELRRIIEKQS